MTSRQSLEVSEQREQIFRDADYRCEVCGKSVYTYGTPQLAHRIAQTKPNIKMYSLLVIHHRLNLAPVCSLRCNDKCNIGNRPEQVKELVSKIKESMQNVRRKRCAKRSQGDKRR